LHRELLRDTPRLCAEDIANVLRQQSQVKQDAGHEA
jgi:hypothetical protein